MSKVRNSGFIIDSEAEILAKSRKSNFGFSQVYGQASTDVSAGYTYGLLGSSSPTVYKTYGYGYSPPSLIPGGGGYEPPPGPQPNLTYLGTAGNDVIDLRQDLSDSGYPNTLDTVLAGAGNDLIYTGLSQYTLVSGDTGVDTLSLTAASSINLINRYVNFEYVYGSTGNDTFITNATGLSNPDSSTRYFYQQHIDGGASTQDYDTLQLVDNPNLNYGWQTTILSSGELVFFMTTSPSNNLAISFSGIEAVRGSKYDDVFNTDLNNRGVKDFFGGLGNDTIYVSAANAYGETGDDYIRIGTYNSVEGTIGTVNANGGAGNDTFSYVAGNATIDGGADYNILDFGYYSNPAFPQEGLVFDGIGSASGTISGSLTLPNTSGWKVTWQNIQQILGTGRDDRFVLLEGTHIDLNGAYGNDTIDFSRFTNGVTFTLGQTSTFGKFSNIENIYGTSKVDNITGDNSDNEIHSGGGADTLNGGGGNDTIFVDGITGSNADGGDGIDTYSLRESSIVGGVIIDVTAQRITAKVGGTTAQGTIVRFERYEGTAGDDDFRGGTGDDYFIGGDGNDTFTGGGGNNTFVTGAGTNQNANGGTGGINTIDFRGSGPNGLTLDLATGTASYDSGNGVVLVSTFSNFQIIYATDSKDTIIGTAGNETIYAGSGDDVVTGNGGSDTISLGDGNDTLNIGGGTSDVTGGNDNDTFNISGGINHTIAGGFGNDIFNVTGGTGLLLYGDSGYDVLNFTRGTVNTFNGDRISFINRTAPVDISVFGLSATRQSLDLGGGDSISYFFVNTFEGTRGGDRIVGSNADEIIIGGGVTQGTGSDNLIGDGGDDTIIVGRGSSVVDGGLNGTKGDTLSLEELDFGVTLTNYEAGSTSQRTLSLGNNTTIYATSIEHLRATDYDDTVYITALGAGIGYGNIDAGDGNDTLSFARYGDNSSPGVTYTLGAAFDPLGNNNGYNFEKLVGTTRADTLTGSSNNDIIDGNGGNDSLYGGKGDDTIIIGSEPFNIIDGGNDYDTISLEGATADATLDFTTGKIIGVEYASGSLYDDTFYLDPASTIGINGRAGHDIVSYEKSTSANGLSIDLATGTNLTFRFENIEELRLTTKGDTIYVPIDGLASVAQSGLIIDALDGTDIVSFANTDKGQLIKLFEIAQFFHNTEGVEGSKYDDIFEVQEGVSSSIFGGNGNDLISFHAFKTGIEVTAGANITLGGVTYTLNSVEGILGTDYADKITASATGSRIFGGAGSDILTGGAGSDYIAAGTGTDDQVDGGGGTNTLSFEDIEDGITLDINQAGSGSVVHGESGEYKTTYKGIQNFVGSAGDDNVLIHDGVIANVDGYYGKNTLDFSAYGSGVTFALGVTSSFGFFTNFQNIRGTTQVDNITGDGQDNEIHSGGGADTLNGGKGDDIIFVDGVSASNVDGGEGYDTYSLRESALTSGVSFDVPNNRITVKGTDAPIPGTIALIERYEGTAYADDFKGGDGNDYFIGGDGDDTFIGGAGDDVFVAGKGHNQTGTDDSAGNNTLDLRGTWDDVTNSGLDIDLSTGKAYYSDKTLAVDFTGFGTLWGTKFKDTINDTSGNDTIHAEDGDDTVTLLGGQDTIDLGGGNDTVNISAGRVTVDGKGDNDTFNVTGGNLHRLDGGSGNDIFNIKDSEGTVVYGRDGDDILYYNNKNITFFGDSKSGTDTISFENWNSALDIVFKGGDSARNIIDLSGGNQINYYDLNSVRGTKLADKITGSDNNEIIAGGGGSDSLKGMGGDDILIVEDGDTNVDGGSNGSKGDTLSLRDLSVGVDISANAGGNSFEESGKYKVTFTDIEYLELTKHDDKVSFDLSIAANQFRGIDGGEGNDTLYFRNANAGVIVSLTSENAFFGDLNNFENVVGTRFGDTLTGSSADNILDGGTGGTDILDGGLGNDTLIADDIDDRVYGGLGYDTVNYSRAASITLDLADGRVTGIEHIIATSGDDTIYLLPADDGSTITVEGGDGLNDVVSFEHYTQGGVVVNLGANTIDGTYAFVGVENIYGSEQNDVFVLPATGILPADVHIDGKGGTDYVSFEELPISANRPNPRNPNVPLPPLPISINVGSIFDQFQGFEGIIGSDNNDNFVLREGQSAMLNGGGGSLNSIVFTTFTHALNLTFSDDITVGGANYHLTNIIGIGGSNLADIIHGDIRDNFIVGNGGIDMLYGGDGKDTVGGGAGNDILYGEAGDDFLLGNAQHDTIYGDFDADSASNNGDFGKDFLGGGTGNDTLYGGYGEDYLRGNSGRDTLYGGAGNDRVEGGNGIDRLYGGADNDTLDGGASNDTLFGESGDDILIDNSGTNQLTGGTGRDTFVLNTPVARNTIMDFDQGPAGDFLRIGELLSKGTNFQQGGDLNAAIHQYFQVNATNGNLEFYIDQAHIAAFFGASSTRTEGYYSVASFNGTNINLDNLINNGQIVFG